MMTETEIRKRLERLEVKLSGELAALDLPINVEQRLQAIEKVVIKLEADLKFLERAVAASKTRWPNEYP